jgi:lipoprotein-anchoring transpeptidase ErfK/SrfK
MNVRHAVAAVGFGVVVSLVAFTASATPRTIYDPASHGFITYDPDKVLRDAHGPARSPSGAISIPHADPDPKFDRQVVNYDTAEDPGTIIIDTGAKFLYYVLEDGQALRMGVGVGREGFGWTGVVHVGNKQVEPKWFPPADMVQRQPELAKYVADGMPGGKGNPLGERALYLYDENGKDTLYRIHGTIEPWSIGHNVSSGCIRMLNENIIALYDMVPLGTKVVVV